MNETTYKTTTTEKFLVFEPISGTFKKLQDHYASLQRTQL